MGRRPEAGARSPNNFANVASGELRREDVSEDVAHELRRRLTPLIRKTQPYAKRIAHKAIWVEPELAEIEYHAKSADKGKVRHPFSKGIRDDL
jgi:hypothetical protein